MNRANVTMTEEQSRLWRPEILGFMPGPAGEELRTSDDLLPYYDAIARSVVDGDVLVELGVYRGRSAAFLVERLEALGRRVTFEAVDLAPCPAALAGVAGVAGVSYRREYSARAAESHADGSVRFAFVDAAHDYESKIEDIRAWWPKIMTGGILAGHDYGWGGGHEPGVKQAVDEFFGARAHPVPGARSVWEVCK